MLLKVNNYQCWDNETKAAFKPSIQFCITKNGFYTCSNSNPRLIPTKQQNMLKKYIYRTQKSLTIHYMYRQISQSLLKFAFLFVIVNQHRFTLCIHVYLYIFFCFYKFFRGEHFRTAFGRIHTLPTFFDCPVIALSATLTKALWASLPKQLGLRRPKQIAENPDKPNIKLVRRKKPSNKNIHECSEAVYLPLLHKLKEAGDRFPVTLCYMPLDWCSNAQMEAIEIFGPPDLFTTNYAIFFSTQDQSIISHVLTELQKESPVIRLVFCSAAMGMGFDSPSITQIIHAKPPRTMIDFLQQIGRAGRQQQDSLSVVHFNANDIAPNVCLDNSIREYCLTQDCLRLTLLCAFGFDKPVTKQPGCKCCMNCARRCKCGKCTADVQTSKGKGTSLNAKHICKSSSI